MVSKRQGSFWFHEQVPGHAPVPSGVSAAIAIVAAALLLLGPSPADATVSGVDGDLAYETGRGIGVASSDGVVHTPPGLASRTESLRGPAWSPNATRLAFTATRAGNVDIYSVARDGTDPHRLTRDPASDSGATWSPDGDSIAFESTRDGEPDIYVMSADGSAPRRLTSAPGGNQHPAWSPDGRRIAFESSRDGNLELYVMAADGSAQRRLTFGPLRDYDPSWSPDGREIAFVSGAPQTDLFAISPHGGRTRRLTTDPTANESPAWSPDGRLIAFSSDRAGPRNIWLYVIEAHAGPEAHRRGLGVLGRHPDWAQLPPPALVPTPGSTANVTPTGTVLVHVLGTGAFVPLTSPREIPLDTRIDARAGAVKLSTAVRGGGTTTTTASGAIFSLDQDTARGTTELVMLNSRPCASGRASSAPRRRPPPDSTLKVKVLSSRHNQVKVVGKYISAFAYGTAWTTINSCSRTAVRVTEGTVIIRDRLHKRTVSVRGNYSVSAKPGR